MDTLTRPKRWTEIARELQQAQRREEACRQRDIGRDMPALFFSFNRRALMGLPILREGRDEDM